MNDYTTLLGMSLFVEVARTGNFSQAGRNLAVPVATLSRRIAAMEREFGVRLFNRSTRRVELTEAGRRFFERCGHLIDEARLAQESLREVGSRPSGHVCVSMPVDLGVHYIGPLLPEFVRQFPDITFDLDLSPRHADPLGEHVDLAIRLGAVRDEKLVARRIGSIEQALFAAPAYLDLRGKPAQPADLVEHECIVLRAPQRRVAWRLQRDGEVVDVAVQGRFMLNNVGLMRLLAERGMGIAALPPLLVREAVAAGRLVQVLAEWGVPRLPIHAAMASRMQAASVRALVDFLASRLGAL
ncbi:DNA-binding transcriptional LysR family regulator [Oxalobacteraceae bacterium GrIS 1.11]